VEPGEKAALIRLVLDGRPAFIDTATVYGEGTARVNPILGVCLRESRSTVAIINKIGANLVSGPGLGERSVAEFQQGLSELGRVEVTLVHKASEAWIDRDAVLHDAVRRSRRSDHFGICTNSATVLEAYSRRMQIDAVQVALNLLDYQESLPVLQLARKLAIPIMARSVLSSGLLGGRYGPGDVDGFTDDLRRRYRESASNREIFARRMEKTARILGYYERLREAGMFQGSFAAFCYLAVGTSPEVHCIVAGGSTADQLRENLRLPDLTLPREIVEEIVRSKVAEWSAPYLGS
jgi:aryl-alcohol dehydrogenase-like predicted oxidoreductase